MWEGVVIMAKLEDYNIEMEIVPKSKKIIAYQTQEFITPEEFTLLSQNIQDKFAPVYESYKIRYIK